MEGASDALMAVMSDIVDKAQELAKSKIAKLPIAQSQPTGPPMITNPPMLPAAQSSTGSKPARKRAQQYAEWDKKEYTTSKDGRQKRVDAREEQREKAQMESAKRDLLVYKQMVYELKAVLKSEKDKKVKKAINMEIRANEDIIQTMIQSGVPDMALPPDIELQITMEKNKSTAGSKQSASGNDKKSEGKKTPRSAKTAEEPVKESDKAKNRSSRQQKATEGETEDEKAKNCQKQREDTLDLFALPDFLDDDEEDDDFEPPVQRRTRRKAVPLPADDNDEEEEDNKDDDDDMDKDEDYDEEDNGDDDDDDEDEDDDDDEEITIQVGKVDERK